MTALNQQIVTSEVVNSDTGDYEVTKARVGKSAWLEAKDGGVVEQLSKRIGVLTGLDLRTAEQLQVANYGIAGMYLPHYDYSHVKFFLDSARRSRF